MRHFFSNTLAALAEIAERLGVKQMYIDAQQQYSVAQVVTATAVSTNAIDHSQDRNFGIGEPMVIVITVGSAAVTAGTLTIQLQSDTTSAFGAPVTVATSPAIQQTTLVAGYKYVLPVPPDLLTQRWSRLNYVIVTITTVTLTAELQPASMVQNEVYYPAGVTIQ